MDPAGEQTSLDDADAGLLLGQERTQLGTRRVEGREAKLAGGLNVEAGDALVFAQVDGKNGSVDAVFKMVFMVQAPRGGCGV